MSGIFINRSDTSSLWHRDFRPASSPDNFRFRKMGAEHPFPPRSPLDFFMPACKDPSQALEIVFARFFLNPYLFPTRLYRHQPD